MTTKYLNDYNSIPQQTEVMKLFLVPRNTKVRVLKPCTVPPGAPLVTEKDIIMFHHCDGMYSYCHNEKGEVVHIPAWEEVELVKNE